MDVRFRILLAGVAAAAVTAAVAAALLPHQNGSTTPGHGHQGRYPSP
jgi:hypothetical protein